MPRQFALHIFRAEAARPHRRHDVAGTDAIHPDMAIAQLNRSGTSQIDQPRLGRAISVQARITGHPGDGRCRDDRSAAALPHMRHRMLDAKKGRAQQDILGPVPSLDRRFLDRTHHPARPGVVEQDIDSAEFLDGMGDQGSDIAFDGDIRLDETRIRPLVAAEGSRFGPTFRVQIAAHDMRAFRRHPDRRFAADPARRTRDNRNLALQSRHLTLPLIHRHSSAFT